MGTRRPRPGLSAILATGFLHLLLSTAARPESTVLVRRSSGGNLALVSEALAQQISRARGAAPRIVELSGDSAADAARISRECGSADVVYAVGVDAATSVAEAGPAARLVALGVPNPSRMKGGGVYVSVYPSLRKTFEFARNRLGADRVALLYSPAQNRETAETFAMAAASSGIALVPVPAGSSGELVRALKGGLEGVDALILAVDPLVFDRQSLRLIVERTAAHRVPTIGFLPELVSHGVTIALSCDPAAVAATALAEAANATSTRKREAEVASMTVSVSRRSAELIGLKPESLGAQAIR